MGTDHRRPGEPGRPMGIDAERMIMGGVADGAINLAGESLGGDAAGAAPAAFERAASERSVAGEGELAAASGLHRALVTDAAAAAWISRMPDAVQHHLGDRALALLAFGDPKSVGSGKRVS